MLYECAHCGKVSSMKDICEWTEDSDGNYETSCNNIFTITDGTPTENDMSFCPYCGKLLIERRYYETYQENDPEGAPPPADNKVGREYEHENRNKNWSDDVKTEKK